MTATLSVRGELRIDDLNVESSEKLSFGLEKATNIKRDYFTLLPNGSKVVEFEAPIDFIGVECNKAVKFNLNGGLTDFDLQTTMIWNGCKLTSITIKNTATGSVKTEIKVISGNGTII